MTAIPTTVPSTGRVVHCRRAAFDLYIGHEFSEFPESIWSNLIQIGRDCSREQAIDKCEVKTCNDKRLMPLIPKLTGLTVGCWCHPQHGHGHVLLKLIREYWERALGCRLRLVGFIYIAETQLELGLSIRAN